MIKILRKSLTQYVELLNVDIENKSALQENNRLDDDSARYIKYPCMRKTLSVQVSERLFLLVILIKIILPMDLGLNFLMRKLPN
jgi:hypothetical protein